MLSKITLQNCCDCYAYGKSIYQGTLQKQMAIRALVRSGMVDSSASYYLQCVVSMLSGNRYTATVNEMATTFFLNQICKEFGIEGLRNALRSMRKHLDYQKDKNNLPGLEALYQNYIDALG